MNKKEYFEISETLFNTYTGILNANREFEKGKDAIFEYDFCAPEYEELRLKYRLEEIAGGGSDFERARRLQGHFAPRLTHSPWYDNHIECNSSALLEYSYEKPDCGINCLNKAKILAELALAVGIYARRVCIMPYSAFDFDNHVVTEIYDRARKKWIMFDPSTNGYFINAKKEPLSVLEIRECFSSLEFASFVSCSDKRIKIASLRKKYISENAYIAKNLAYFYVDIKNGFGDAGELALFAPRGFSVRDFKIFNAEFRLANLPAEYDSVRPDLQRRLEELADAPLPVYSDVSSLLNSPLNK